MKATTLWNNSPNDGLQQWFCLPANRDPDGTFNNIGKSIIWFSTEYNTYYNGITPELRPVLKVNRWHQAHVLYVRCSKRLKYFVFLLPTIKKLECP